MCNVFRKSFVSVFTSNEMPTTVSYNNTLEDSQLDLEVILQTLSKLSDGSRPNDIPATIS